MTYCINSECPFRDCEKHLTKSRGKGKVYVANYYGVCRRYITWVLKEVEQMNKIDTDWLSKAIETIQNEIADKLTKDNVTVYRVKNIIRVDIKEE